MPPSRPLLVTRKLPDAVTQRLLRDYDARLNPADKLYGRAEILAGAKDCDALLPCPTDKITAESSPACRAPDHRDLLGRLRAYRRLRCKARGIASAIRRMC